MSINERMVAVSKRIAAEGIGKTRKNTHQGYNFRGVDEVMNAFAPLLADAGIYLRPSYSERTVVERQGKSGALIYVTVKGDFTFTDDKGGAVTVGPFYGEAMDSGDKATNKAMAAAFKYAMFQTFCVPLEGVIGGDADSVTHEVSVELINTEQAATLRDMLEVTASDTDKFCAAFGCDSVDALPASKYDNAVAALNRKAQRAA